MIAAQRTHAAERLPSWEEIPAALYGNISGSHHPPVGIRQVEQWRELGKSWTQLGHSTVPGKEKRPWFVVFVNFRGIIAYFEVATMSLDKLGVWKRCMELALSSAAFHHWLDAQEVTSLLPPSCLQSEKQRVWRSGGNHSEEDKGKRNGDVVVVRNIGSLINFLG